MRAWIACVSLLSVASCTTHGGDAPASEPDVSPAVTETPGTAGGWTTVRVADGREVSIANAPETIDLDLKWQPCAEDSIHCRELAAPPAGSDRRIALEGFPRDGASLVAVLDFLPDSRARYVLGPRDGVPFFAIEGPRGEGCSLGTIGASDDGAVVEVAYDHADGYASRAYFRGPLAADPGWARVAARLERKEFPDFIGEDVTTAGGRVVVAANGGPLRWFDEKSQRWTEIEGSHDGWACCFAAHGDVVTFMTESIPERVLAARIGERARTLRPQAAGGGTSPIAIDGGHATWVEGRGRDNNNIYERIELWTGDVTKPFGIVRERRLATLPRTTMATPRIGGGSVVVALRDRPGDFAVIAIASKDARLLAPPRGLVVERILWVTADEIAVQIGPPGMHAEPSTFRRIAIRSLPPLPGVATTGK